MKKALNLVITYFITLLLSVFFGTLFYSLYINVLNFVAGTEIQFFVQHELSDAFFYISFCVLFVLCLLTSYYRIRHPGGMSQVLAFVCLAILTWGCFVPVVYKLSEKYSTGHEVSKPGTFSKGYFRQAGDKVYYFTKDFALNEKKELESSAIIINTEDGGVVSIENVIDSPELDLRKESAPYREILVKNTFQENDFPLSVNFRNIIKNYKDNMDNGFLGFLGFFSFALAACSVFALTNAFHWNLLNTMLITSMSFLILIINSHPEFFAAIEKGRSFGFLSKLDDNPFLILLNFILAFLFISIGVVLFLIRKHREEYL